MDRAIVLPGQMPLDSDILAAQRYAYFGLSKVIEALVGTSTTLQGLSCLPTSPASLQVRVTPGQIFILQSADATAFGSLALDTTHQIVKQGISWDDVVLNCPAPATAGQSINYLIQIGFSQADDTPVARTYYNSSNPLIPWTGPNNTGAADNTRRANTVVIQAKAGTAATTGTQTTPSADSGFVGAYVVTVAQGQTQITSGNITTLSTAFLSETLPQKISTATGDGRYLQRANNGSDILDAAAFKANISASAVPNFIVNSGFRFWGRRATSIASGSYALDSWYGLCPSGNITVSQVTAPETGAAYGMRFTQPDSTAKQLMAVQPLENRICLDLRGVLCSFATRVQSSAATPIRWAVLEWTGAANAITRNVVTNWSSTNFGTAGSFFTATSVNILATGSTTVTANTWTPISGGFTPSSSANNLFLVVWCDAIAANATFSLNRAALMPGSGAGWQRPDPVGEWLASQRFYSKSYDDVFSPGTAGSSVAQALNGRIVRTLDAANPAPSNASTIVYLPTDMVIPPTVTLYSDYSGASGKVRNATTSIDYSAFAYNPGGRSMTAYVNDAAATWNQGALMTFHYAADASL